MSRDQLAQCLLFVVERTQCTSPFTPSVGKGYALLPEDFKVNHSEVLEVFTQNNVQVISNETFSLPSFDKEDALQVFEVLLDEAVRTTPLFVIRLEDVKPFKDLLRKTNLQFITECISVNLRPAIDDSNLDIIRQFLSCGAHYDSIRRSAETLLHAATRGGPVSLVNLALEHGANIEGKSNYLNYLTVSTALDAAVRSGSVPIVKELIKRGANINARNKLQQTPMFSAAVAGHFNIFRILVNCGAHIDYEDSNMKSMLHAVCEGVPVSIVFRHILEWYFFDLKMLIRVLKSKIRLHFFGVSVSLKDMANHRKNKYLIFLCHLIKTLVADPNAAEKEADLDLFTRRQCQDNLASFWYESEVEMARMKSETIADTDISFCDVLTNSASKVTCYLKNDAVAQVLTWDNLHFKYPIYASLLFCQIQKGMLRKQSVNQGIGVCTILFPQFSELPREIKEMIMNYLSTEDITILKIACLPADSDLWP